MAYQSPFLRLDQLKRARDEDTFNQMVESARQFGQAPLVYDKLVKENEDRAAKAKQQQFTNDLAESTLLEKGMHNDALEKIAGQNADTAGIKAETGKQAEERRTEGAKTKRSDKVLTDSVSGFISQNSAMPDAEIIQQMTTKLAAEGYNEDQVAAVVSEYRRSRAAEDFKKQQEEARTNAVVTRANRGPNTPSSKPRLMGESVLKSIGEKKAMHKKVVGLIQKVSNIAEGDAPGLLQDLKEKYGSIAGIQDNGVRMEYLGLFNKILRDRSGMAVTAPELERLEQEIPNWRAGKNVIIDALGRIAEDLADEVVSMEDVQANAGGRYIPNRTKLTVPKPVPPRNQGEGSKAYAQRLEQAGLSRAEIMKAVLSGG